MKSIFTCDFKAFPIGAFPYDPDHSAMGEYHYTMPKGHRYRWVDQVCNHTWSGHGPSWMITEFEGSHFMECMRIEKGRPHTMHPTLQTGSTIWFDYEVSCLLRRISTNGIAGLAFCMKNTLNTLVFQMQEGGVALVYRHKGDIKVLAEAEFAHDSDTFYNMKVMCGEGKVKCYIDYQLLIELDTPLADNGKIGITADCPTQFTNVAVTASDVTIAKISMREFQEKSRALLLKVDNPAMTLWKKIDLQDFGASRQVRFGKSFIVLAQGQKRVSRDAYPHISCLTAINVDGKVLWQRGEASEKASINGKISADLPFQVYDIDGDGNEEVICAINFELLILNGETGAVKHRVATPKTDNSKPILGIPTGGYAFDRLNVDAISFANLSGAERPTEILVKDRYCRLYAYDCNLNLIWHYHSDVNIGHFPLAVDINGDRRDEILLGHCMLSADGQKLWEYPITSDHVDEIIYGKFMEDSDEGFFACVAGSEGFFIGDTKGNIIVHDYIGHAQRISCANYDPSRPGYEIAVSTYWGHQGVIYLYDSKGNLILEMENELNGNLLTPVNWKGDGQDYFLTNADPVSGGLYNINGQLVVPFPDDGHPVLCAEAINLTGDARDELVVWDYNSMWIYTQGDEQDKNDYTPQKPPRYNASNYRGEYSF